MISKQTLAVAEHPTGVDLTVPVITIEGQGKGPRVYIQANIHGAEVQGNAVIHHLLESFHKHPPLGTVTLVPLANPIGINHKNGEFTLGRFDPVTGVNWNRQCHFDSGMLDDFVTQHKDSTDQQIRDAFRAQLIDNLESKLNSPWGVSVGQHLTLRLQRLAVEADIVLDLHTGPVSARHLYVPGYARKRARHFNVPLNILMPSDFSGAFDEAHFCPWWQLSERFAAQDRQARRELPVMVDAFTLELGSQEWLNVKHADRDALGILNYLQHRGLWHDFPFPVTLEPQYACELKDYRAFFSPDGGQIEYVAPLQQLLPAGQPLARLWHFDRLGEHNSQLQQTLSLPVDAIPVLHFASASVQRGTELYKLLTNVFPL